ncbi:DUF4870 domain-containing protein [Natronorarus salvus]|uniref:DUF4870 domain-containing protein n=1 Tax=Natronorarus salvus TaxID=3117733 RepID=UPI002F25F555
MGTETSDIIETNGTDGTYSSERVERATFGLEANVAGACSYLFGFVTGLVFLLAEDENEFVRFHAAQSVIASGAIFGLSVLLGLLPLFLGVTPVVGWLVALGADLLSLLLVPVALVLWIVLLVKAYRGERFGLPVVGDLARRYA